MDSSNNNTTIKNFKQLFLNLRDGNSDEALNKTSDELILQSTSIELNEKQEKFKEYTDCFINKEINLALIYTLSRLVGGISSTGVEYRKGFSLALAKLMRKVNENVLFDKLYEVIMKESYFKKTEVQSIKNALSSGRIVLFEILLSTSLSVLPSEIFTKILSQTLSTVESNSASEKEAIVLFQKLIETLLSQEKIQKKTQKSIEDNLENWLCLSKDHKNYLFFISIVFILNASLYRKGSQSTNAAFLSFLTNFIKAKIKYSIKGIFSDSANIATFFNKIVDNNKNHISLELFFSLLKTSFEAKDTDLLAQSWNCLTDKNSAVELIKKSNKNYQYLLAKFSLFLLDTISDIDKIYSIFDFNYFKSFISFEGGKDKHNHINQIVQSLSSRLSNTESGNKLEAYSKQMLSLYLNLSLSPIANKSFFSILYRSLTENARAEFIDKVVNLRNKSSDEQSEEDERINEEAKELLYAQFNIIKAVISMKALLSKDLIYQILDFVLKEYFSERNSAYQEIVTFIEDKLIFFYLFVNSSDPKEDKKISSNPDDEENNDNDSITISGLIKFNKHLNTLINNKTISIDEEDYKQFKSSLLKVSKFFKTAHKFNDSCKKDFNKLIASLLLFTQVMYLKNSSELNDTLFDLSELFTQTQGKEKLDDKFFIVFTEICLQLNSIGSQSLSEYVMKIFRKASKYLNKGSVDVLVNFIKS